MPELPEVETVVRDLRKSGLEGCVIRSVSFPWAKTAAKSTPAIFQKQIQEKNL